MDTWGSCSQVRANGVTCNFIKSHASFGNRPSSPECHLEGVELGKWQGWEQAAWERHLCSVCFKSLHLGLIYGPMKGCRYWASWASQGRNRRKKWKVGAASKIRLLISFPRAFSRTWCLAVFFLRSISPVGLKGAGMGGERISAAMGGRQQHPFCLWDGMSFVT